MHPHIHHKSKVLFVLKYRQLYQDIIFNECEKTSGMTYFSSGLLNSARQVNEMLQDHGIESHLVQVLDNNGIDREVNKYKPDFCIIEALWVVPGKFDILHKLHPKVKWIIRLHSETPFIAMEGIAMEFIFNYLKHKNVYVAANSPRMLKDLKAIISTEYQYKLMYLPNYYDPDKNHEHDVEKNKNDGIDIGNFSAIRPLKSNLLQAMAAIRYAKETSRCLRFHINGTRIENKGDPVIKNIRALFNNIDNYQFKLVEHSWLEPKNFRKLVGTMDMVMQVSATETFCIVAADAVAQNVPIVVSKEIPFASRLFVVTDFTDIDAIVGKMYDVELYGKLGLTFLNKRGLQKYNKHTIAVWLKVFG